MSSSGVRAERDLVHRFWNAGFAGLRAPASGGGTILPRPDLIAGSKNHNKFFVIEVKTVRKDNLYLDSSQIEGLQEFANRLGFKPILAVKFKNHKKDYVFLEVPDHLLDVNNSNNFKITYLHALNVGLKFNELIGEYQQMKLV
ncbi:MAG: Holliday junction resolvase [Asgard group archaeon]|nr:Holliday junction resolvase [Asgard group archaeon]